MSDDKPIAVLLNEVLDAEYAKNADLTQENERLRAELDGAGKRIELLQALHPQEDR